MSRNITISLADFEATPEKTTILLVDDSLKLSKASAKIDKKGAVFAKASTAANFTGKSSQTMDLIAPAVSGGVERLLVFGVGNVSQMQTDDWVKLGGRIGAKLLAIKATQASLLMDLDGVAKKAAARHAADIALGVDLRGYKFAGYKKKSTKDEDADAKDVTLKIHCADLAQAMKLVQVSDAVAAGVCIARDLVNQPANKLGPEEFVTEIDKLKDHGVEIDVLDERAMNAYGMDAILSVGKGSDKPTRAVVMSWWGAKSKRSAPVAFVGKGVTFDTGGISLKPAKGMEDMKGDMGGAACVTGLMHTVAARKAQINVIGLVGLVENMPSSSASRPGDIVTSASGQTIEILNTDAEGRLVLADMLWYAEKELNPRPKAIIDLATLTGAILVALGKQYAGLFSNDDRLASMISDAGDTTGEKVWRMPLDKSYDKMIDSQIADMKNIGGRYAGATTAAQFLQRFVTDTPWAHLDVAGTAMASGKSDINTSWGSGFGVRLLNDMLIEGFEK